MILKILSRPKNPYSSRAKVRVQEVQSRCIIGNARSNSSTTKTGKGCKGRVEVNVRGEVNCQGVGVSKKARGPGRPGSRSE